MDLMSMSQLLGNFGEFVGAIEVVATLFHLALQVRHSKAATVANTRSVEEGHKCAKAQAYQARTDSAARLFQLRDPDAFAKVWSDEQTGGLNRRGLIFLTSNFESLCCNQGSNI